MSKEIEQDQEKILNASSQLIQNSLYTVASMKNLTKPQTKVEIKTAKQAVEQTQSLISQGVKLEGIKNYLANTAIGKSVIKASGNIENFAKLMIKKANINNNMNNIATQSQSKKISKKL